VISDNRVAVTRVPSYDELDVAVAINDVSKPFGGFESLLAGARRVVLKVNLLRGARPEQAVTTHPAVVRAVARAVIAAGATPVLADSPGAGLPHSRRTLEKCYRRAGYLPLADEVGLELNYDTTFRTVHYEEGTVARRFDVITPVLEADAVINLCKLKTHAFTVITGAVKNLFGVLPGYDKPAYHARLRKVDHFADMLLDLAEFVKPVISIMDAVVAMEGNGPGLGEPRNLGLILASPSPLTLDVAAGAVTGLPPEGHPVLRAAARRGAEPNKPGDLAVTGPALETLRPADWKWPPTVVDEVGFAGYGPLQGVLTTVFRSGYSVQPVVVADKCTGCGLCREACPVGAIGVIGEKSLIEKKFCIRCYCCHEACAYDAIDLHRPFLHRLIGGRV
jgi:uncharacterized protein (DUF362 family)/Pyruvate/2-oxoacid:ferredoxin oxidoreductase delta subunit